MTTTPKLPSYISDSISKSDLSGKELISAAVSYLRLNGTFGETWVLLFEKSLVLLDVVDPPQKQILKKKTFTAKVVRRLKKYLRLKEPPIIELVPSSVNIIEEIDRQRIESLSTENLITGGLFTGHIDGKDRLICHYTASTAARFHALKDCYTSNNSETSVTPSILNDSKDTKHCPKCNRPLNESDGNICKACQNKSALFIRVLSFIPRYKKQTILILVCILSSSLFGLLTPYIGGSVFFDKVLSPHGKYHGHIIEAVLIMIAAQFISLLLSIAYGRVNAAMTADVIFDLKTEVFGAMQRLSLSFYNNKQTGSLITGVNDNAMQLQYFFHDGLPYLIVNIISLIGIIIIMMVLDWKLALLAALPAPVVVIFMKSAFPKIWALFSRRYRATSYMSGLLSDNLSGMRVVKAFGKESTEIGRFSKANERVTGVDMEIGVLTSYLFPIAGFLMSLGGLVVWAVGSFREVSGAITLGTLITFTGYIGMIYSRLDFLSHVMDWWSSCMNAAHRIFEIIDSPAEIVDIAEPVDLSIKGAVKLDNVTFGYEPFTPVIHTISLDVKAGEMIGFVGHSGAGKSTLINLITRLYDVNQGNIYIDGVPIKNIAIKSLRSQVGMVLQDTFLFTGTIAENIAFARPEATMKQVIEASKTANAHQFIVSLPDGYDTILGKHGYTMSGGERQRVAIARAILHDPKILILDEATSSVDTETEQQIQDALSRLIKGRTTFAIAHRLSTLRNADRLVVIEKGKITEAGTHDELIAKEGAYYGMLQKQKEALKITGVM